MVLTGCMLLAVAPTALPQNPPWAQKLLLGVTNHDFGTVPHGAQLKHRLVLKNIYAVPLEITEIRSSCGCLSFKSSHYELNGARKVLKPKEEGYIDLSMDASRFNGPKSVLLYVTVGPQFVSTAVVQVTAVARGDVVFNPGEINFGPVQGGQTPTKFIDVEYAGTLNWHVTEVVKSKTAPFSVNAQQMFREKPTFLLKVGKVGYRLDVTMNPNAPPGFFREELLLRTDDPASPLLTVYVEGNIQAGGLSVKPGQVNFDVVKVNQKVTKKVAVSGNQPFKILSIDGVGGGIQVDVPDKASPIHEVQIHFQPTQPGEINRKLILHTDWGKGETLAIPVQANAAP